MDWEMLYCPNRFCRLYGVPWPKSALVKNGTSRGYKQALCRVCGQSVFLRYGTAYFELEADPLIFNTAIRALAEGNSLRATARLVQIDKDTAAAWLDRAARHCRQVMLCLWQHLPVTECQLDELWSFVHTKEQNLFAAKLGCETYGDAWVWVAFAPTWRLVVAFVVGKRTQASANVLLERVAHVTDDRIPFFTSDQLAEYRTALLEVYGQWYQAARNGSRGCFPKRRRVAPPDLVYAQVVTQRERGQVVAVTHKVVFGSAEAVQTCLEASAASTSASASATVHGHVCTISLTKTPSTTTVCNGANTQVTYTYVVTNNSDFFNVSGSVSDDQFGSVGSFGPLAPGASATLTKVATVNGTMTNTGTATGTFDDPASTTASAQASATVTGQNCGNSQITPTGTTCTQFNNNTAATLSTLQYAVKSGKVTAVSPGVFFYWVKVTAAAGSNTFTINQTVTSNYAGHFFKQASGSFAYTSGCSKINANISTSNGVTTVTFNTSSAGTYIIGIKYDSKSVEGFTASSPTTVHYDFSTGGVPGSTQGLNLVPKP